MNIIQRKPLLGFVLTILMGAFIATPAIASAETDKSKKIVKRGTYAGAKTTEYPAWFNDSFLDIKDDIAAANAAGKQLIVLFTQDGCPYCNALVERNFAQKDIEALMRGKFVVNAMNIVGDRAVTSFDGNNYTEKTYSEAMKVQFTPTLMFFNDKGEIILRLNGYMPPDQFKTALNYMVEKKGQLSFQDYLELNSPPPKAGKLNQESFFQLPPYNLAQRTHKKPIAVFFEQKDCPNCDTLHQKVLTDRDTRNLLKKYTAVQLDMWDKTPLTTPEGKTTTAREWAKQLDVKYAPTIVLFNADGTEIIRSEAFFKVFHTQSIFDYVESGAYKQHPNFQRYLTKRADHFREQGKDVDIWSMSDEAAIEKK